MEDLYKLNKIYIALPEELTLMLFNGAVDFIIKSNYFLKIKNYEKSNEFNIKTQKIIREFMVTLDMSYEMSKDLYKLYDYILYKLIESNIKKNIIIGEEIEKNIIDLRDNWKKLKMVN